MLSSEITEFDELSSENLNFFTPDHKSDAQHLRIFNLLMWRNRKKSISFAFRIKRFHQLKLIFPHGTNFISRLIKTFWRLLQWLLIRFEAYVIASSPFFPMYLNLFIRNLKPHPLLKSVLEKVSPDLVIYPSSAYEAIGNDVISECKRLKIKSLFLIDNWDNLSSKSVLWQKPSYISVWGQQSKTHAIEIQGMHDKQIFTLGTPRFDSYFQLRDDELKSPYPFKYILFVGTTLPFNEAQALVAMNQAIDNNKSLFGDTKIIYRPHPWRQGKDSISQLTLNHVVIDEQLREAYSKQDFSENIQPEISYYPKLLQNAEFVVGGLTSMVIEATIFRKPFVALVHEDGTPVSSPKNIYHNFTHFRDIDRMKNIIFCDSLDAIDVILEVAHKKKLNNRNEEIDADREHFYSNNNQAYCENLDSFCQTITSP